MTKTATLSRRRMLQHLVLSTPYCAITAPLTNLFLAGERCVRPVSDVDTWTDFVEHVELTNDTLWFRLTDGRIISAPIDWYPRLAHGTPEERRNWEIGSGIGVHWPDLDEDVSVENLLKGQASGESQKSIQRWLDEHKMRTAR